MIRHILLALSASPLVAATLPHDAVWNDLEGHWDMPLHPLAFHPPKGCHHVHNAKDMAGDRVERVTDCRQDDPFEHPPLAVLSDLRAAPVPSVAYSHVSAFGGAHLPATHGTPPSIEYVLVGGGTSHEMTVHVEPPKPVPLPGSLAFLAALSLLCFWRVR